MVHELSFKKRPVPDLWCESVVLPTKTYPMISAGVSVWWVSARASTSGEYMSNVAYISAILVSIPHILRCHISIHFSVEVSLDILLAVRGRFGLSYWDVSCMKSSILVCFFCATSCQVLILIFVAAIVSWFLASCSCLSFNVRYVPFMWLQSRHMYFPSIIPIERAEHAWQTAWTSLFSLLAES